MLSRIANPLCSEGETSLFRAWKAYEKLLEVRGVLDFDLLLIRTIRLLEDHPKVRITLCQTYKTRLIIMKYGAVDFETDSSGTCSDTSLTICADLGNIAPALEAHPCGRVAGSHFSCL